MIQQKFHLAHFSAFTSLIRSMLLFLCVVWISLCIAEDSKEQPYLSQTYIDSLVQSAFYNFVAASETAGGELRQQQAIIYAKSVAQQLKGLAEDDPNRRYILWKVGELENQIYLEEEEIYLKKMYQRQMEINILVDTFNAETGKSRPNIAHLVAIHERMFELSPRKADELAWLIEDRVRNISHEVCYAFEKAFLEGNFSTADKEFDYMQKSRKYLYISPDKYASFENKMKAKKDADDILRNINSYVDKINAILDHNNLADARRYNDVLRKQVDNARLFMSSTVYNTYREKIDTLSALICHKEDSLIACNKAIIEQQGEDAGMDFLENTLRTCGVSNEKIASIDKILMQLPVQKTSYIDDAVNNELDAFENTTTLAATFDFDEINSKVQEKKDSIRTVKEQQTQTVYAQNEHNRNWEPKAKKQNEKKIQKMKEKNRRRIIEIYSCLEKRKIEKAHALFLKYQQDFQQYTNIETYSMLEKSVNQALTLHTQSKQKNQQNINKAKQYTSRMYTLIERGDVEEAYELFKKYEDKLKLYSPKRTFSNLQTVVIRAYEELQKKNQSIQQPLTPSSALSQQQSSVSLTNSENQQSPDEDVDAYAAFDNAQKQAKKQAQKDVTYIYTLLEKNEIIHAYKYFQKKKISLKTYTSAQTYNSLEAAVTQAYESFQQPQSP